MIKVYFFIYILIFTYSVECQNQFSQLISSGVQASYSFEFDEAEDLFTQAIDLNPDHPAPYHYLAQNYLWFYLGTRDLGQFVIFNRYSELALSKAEKLYDLFEC